MNVNHPLSYSIIFHKVHNYGITDKDNIFPKFGSPGLPHSPRNLRIFIYQMPFHISSNSQIDIKLLILSNLLEQGSTNYGPDSPCFFLVNKILLEHRHIHLHIAYGCFHTATTEE